MNKRFKTIVAEEEGLDVCPHCSTELLEVPTPSNQLGSFAALKYLYCEICNKYFTGGKNENSRSGESSPV